MSELDNILDTLLKENDTFLFKNPLTREIVKDKIKIAVLEIHIAALRADTFSDMSEIFRKKLREL